MQLDPEIAQRLYDAADAALAALQYPDDRGTLRRVESQLQSATARARNNDEANRQSRA